METVPQRGHNTTFYYKYSIFYPFLNTEKQKKKGFSKKYRASKEEKDVFDKIQQKHLTIYKNYGKNQISNGRGAGFNSMWMGKGTVQQKGETAEGPIACPRLRFWPTVEYAVGCHERGALSLFRKRKVFP